MEKREVCSTTNKLNDCEGQKPGQINLEYTRLKILRTLGLSYTTLY